MLVLDPPQVLRLGVWCEDVEDDIPATVNWECELCIIGTVEMVVKGKNSTSSWSSAP